MTMVVGNLQFSQIKKACGKVCFPATSHKLLFSYRPVMISKALLDRVANLCEKAYAVWMEPRIDHDSFTDDATGGGITGTAIQNQGYVLPSDDPYP